MSRAIPLAAAIWSPRQSFDVSMRVGFATRGLKPCSAVAKRTDVPAAPRRSANARSAALASSSSNSRTPWWVSRSIASPEQRAEALVEHRLGGRHGGARACARTTSVQCSMRASSASGGDQFGGEPMPARPGRRRAARRRAAARARRSRRAPPGSSSVPALLATRPMPTSGVISSTRSVQRRRSQLAANSSAPPTHTPSTAAIAGTGAASTTRVSRWKPSIVAAQAAESASIAAECRSSPAEKWSPAPRSTIAAHLRVRAGGLDRVGDRGHGLQVPGVAARLAVPGDQAGGAEVGGGDCHVAVSLLRVSTASRQRVAARGSVDDSGLVLGHGQRAGLQPGDGEARAQRGVRAGRARRPGRPAAAPPRTRAAGGTIGSPSATTQWRPSRESAARIAPIACG